MERQIKINGHKKGKLVVCDILNIQRKFYGRVGGAISIGGENIFMFVENGEGISSRTNSIRNMDNGRKKSTLVGKKIRLVTA